MMAIINQGVIIFRRIQYSQMSYLCVHGWRAVVKDLDVRYSVAQKKKKMLNPVQHVFKQRNPAKNRLHKRLW